jgi:hypothetical protein
MSITTIPVWLRNTYCRIDNKEIFEVEGYSKGNKKYKKKALESIEREFSDGEGDIFTADSNFYISGGDIYNYLYDKKGCGAIITLVIVGLKNLYWNHREQLDENEKSELSGYMTHELPSFKDIFDYKNVEKYNTLIDYPVYQLFGEITPYDVLHITVDDFINIINSSAFIEVPLVDTDVVIRLDYEAFDFYNFREERLITNINEC